MRLSKEFIENKIKWWQMVREVWDRCEVTPYDTASTAACKLYIRMQTTKGLRNEMVSHGYRLKYDMKISDLITKNTIDDVELQRVARELFKANKEHDSLK
jgi:hypothetical protein